MRVGRPRAPAAALVAALVAVPAPAPARPARRGQWRPAVRALRGRRAQDPWGAQDRGDRGRGPASQRQRREV